MGVFRSWVVGVRDVRDVRDEDFIYWLFKMHL